MIQRLSIYAVLILTAGISYLGLVVKLQKNELDEYRKIEKIEIKKQKITKKYVRKIKEINVPNNDVEFELMLDKISIPE